MDPEDVYNLDESGLFFRLLPTKFYSFANESRFGGKQLKNRVTLVFISNASGTDKQVIFIGRSASPHAFRGLNSLPLDYYNQKNAWIDSEIFNKILQRLNKKMQKNNQKIMLYIDCCPAHRIERQFDNISVKYLPKNSTSKLQVI